MLLKLVTISSTLMKKLFDSAVKLWGEIIGYLIEEFVRMIPHNIISLIAQNIISLPDQNIMCPINYCVFKTFSNPGREKQ